jgi:hypothetical protein
LSGALLADTLVMPRGPDAVAAADRAPGAARVGGDEVEHAAGGIDAARLAGMLEPAQLRGGIAGFLSQRTFAVITGRDADGRLWTSPLGGR